MRLLLSSLTCLLLTSGAPSGTNPIETDASGIRWWPDFPGARQHAGALQRLLVILVDDQPAGEEASFGYETFRAACLCDERVARLFEAYLVPFYFSVEAEAAAYDPDACAFVEPGLRERRAGEPRSILVMTPGGEVVASIASNTTADALLERLTQVFSENKRYVRPQCGADEEGPLSQARLDLARLDYRAARKELGKEKSDAARLLLARIAREEGDWKDHEKVLAAIAGPALRDEVALERAWRSRLRGDPDAARGFLECLGDTFERQDEALYLKGLVALDLGRREAALESWQTLVRERPPSPWSYRADWAAFCLQREAGTEARSPWLERAYDPERPHPDLALDR